MSKLRRFHPEVENSITQARNAPLPHNQAWWLLSAVNDMLIYGELRTHPSAMSLSDVLEGVRDAIDRLGKLDA